MPLLALILVFAHANIPWNQDAVRLTGESDYVREQAIHRLRRNTKLPELLIKEIDGTRRAEALDVISTLQMRALLPDLIEAAKNDQDGSIFLTINQLVDASTAKKVFDFYRDRLFCRWCHTSEPAKVVIIDTFTRVHQTFTGGEMDRLFADDWPEVQSATLEYIRLAALRGDESLLNYVRKGFSSEYWQLRLQTVYLVSQLSVKKRQQAELSYRNCEHDSSAEVRKTCLKLLGGPA